MFKNVHFITNDNSDYTKLMDYQSIIETLTLISSKNKELFENNCFYIYWGANQERICNIETDNNVINVLIWIADELGTTPSPKIREKFQFIFKNHLRKESEYNNVYPLPLFTPLPNLPKNKIEISKRKYDVFFSGNLNKNRVLLLWGLQGMNGFLSRFLYKLSCLKGFGRIVSKMYCGKEYDFSNKIPNSIIKFTSGFYKGFSPAEYAKLTSNSKIVLNPRGFHSTECFRMYEAMAAGCIVITEKLPQTRIYKDIPVIQVADWSCIYEFYNKIIRDYSYIEKLSTESYDYYRKNLSNNGVAYYIFKTLITAL